MQTGTRGIVANMKPEFFANLRKIGASAAFVFTATAAMAEPKHGIAMYGEPALPPDFVSLPYANPDAPLGGKLVTANVGTFDSLNPYIQKGNVHWQIQYLTGDSLMGRSLDEPFSLYGVIAESIETGPNREWVEFTLRENATFTDGSPITVEDVMWSYETLGTQGHGRYRGFWEKVSSMEQTGPRSIKFTFNEADNELALLAGLRPILRKRSGTVLSLVKAVWTSSQSSLANTKSQTLRLVALSLSSATLTIGAKTSPSCAALGTLMRSASNSSVMKRRPLRRLKWVK